MSVKVKLILYTIFGLITAGSITLNVIYFNTLYETKKQGAIVDDNLDSLITELNETKEKLKEETEKNMDLINDNFDNNESFNEVTKDTVITEQEIVITVPNNHYYATLPDELEEANEMNKFLADQVNYVSDKYNTDIAKRDKIIDDLTLELEIAKESIKEDLADNELGKTQEMIKNNMFKWGLELFISGNFDFTDPINISPTLGIGVNMMFINKFYVRGNIGLQTLSNPDKKYIPQVGVAVGYYF